MNRRTEIIGLAALSVLYLAACEPEPGQDLDTEAEAAEAPVEQRPATPFEDWDINQDQSLQAEEFSTWARDENVLGDWVGDEGLDREAFHQRIVDVWDQNDDDIIGESEWQSGVSNLFAEGEYGAFADWDVDQNAELDLNELAEGMESHGLYARMDGDQDAIIDDTEIGDFFFDIFDVNDDAQLDTTEWDFGRSTWFGDGGI